MRTVMQMVKFLPLVGILLLGFLLTLTALGSTTDGTVDSTNRYAWGENVGWIDFGSTAGNVHITDSALTGYAWGENVGWISLNCSNTSSCATVDYKVSNTNEGTLSGYAWGENAGWIHFAPSAGGVTINSSGTFSGYAWGENVGWISFNCANTGSCATVDYTVTTDWRPTDDPTPERFVKSGNLGFISPPQTSTATPTSTPTSTAPATAPSSTEPVSGEVGVPEVAQPSTTVLAAVGGGVKNAYVTLLQIVRQLYGILRERMETPAFFMRAQFANLFFGLALR